MTVTKLEPAALRERMRKVTAELLGYDLSKLTPSQSVRLDRAATLRLELDDVQSRQLAGLPIDTTKFVSASEALERMLGSDPEKRSEHLDFTGAREELLHFLDGRAAALERRDERIKAAAASKEITSDLVDSPQHNQGVAPTGQNCPVEPPVVELMPEGEVPPKQPHVSFVEHEPSPLRTHSLNNAVGQSRPPGPRPSSPVTTSFFSRATRAT